MNSSLPPQLPADLDTFEPSESPAREDPYTDIVQVWGFDSFPASDPPANW
ncbi:hypothetical protein EV138_1394 [Kribbella voronezhensis]|uniref:Uncharacterized protein n=1 Tax=Kribbella voronezhensis TaxID=2512212 RepID=A0A4R7T7L6_9ACTN|nr:hypothetical protein EV138_1394 [Kribbella voronezhensis]